MSRVRCIALANPGLVFTTFICVHHVPNGQEWNVTNIEIYADIDMTKLLSDDIQLADLPLETQDQIIQALNEWLEVDRRERGLTRLLADINKDAAAARAWN